MRSDNIVPLAELVTLLQVDLFCLLVCYLLLQFILIAINQAFHFQSGSGCRTRNQIYNRLNINKRLSLPVLRYVTEQSVFNLVPLTCSWREM